MAWPDATSFPLPFPWPPGFALASEEDARGAALPLRAGNKPGGGGGGKFTRPMDVSWYDIGCASPEVWPLGTVIAIGPTRKTGAG